MSIDKQKLMDECKNIVLEKLQNIQNAIDSYKTDLNSETKSSAGDKHETGRAMLQLEMEKLGEQYQNVLTQKQVLNKIDVSNSQLARIGSVVVVNNNHYFLATSIGQVKLEDKIIMVVSINSPIGRLLLGKKKKDSFIFNGKEVQISDIL